MALTSYPKLAPRLKKIRAVPVLFLWVFMACYRANIIFIYNMYNSNEYQFSTNIENIRTLSLKKAAPKLRSVQETKLPKMQRKLHEVRCNLLCKSFCKKCEG